MRIKKITYLAETEPIIIKNISAPHPSKYDLILLQALRESIERVLPKSGGKINIHDLFSLDKFKILENFPYTAANINNAVGKLIKHQAVYPYAYLTGKEFIIQARIVLIQPLGERDQYDVRKYRNACFTHSISVINEVIERKLKKPLRLKEIDIENALLEKNEGLWKFFPERLSLQGYFRYLLTRGFQIDKNTSLAVFEIGDFLADLEQYLNSHTRVMKICQGYHVILPEEVELNPDGEYSELPEMLLHLFALSMAMEKVALPNIKDSVKKNKQQALIQKFQLLETLARQMDYDSEGAMDRVKLVFEILSSFSSDENMGQLNERVRDAFRKALPIYYGLAERLLLLDELKMEARYALLKNRLRKEIHTNTINLERVINGVQGPNLTEFNPERELSFVTMDPEKKIGYRDQLFFELSQLYAWASHERRPDIKYFVDERYLLGVISNLSARSLENKKADRFLQLALKTWNTLNNARNPNLDAALSQKQMDFFYSDIMTSHEKKKQSKDKSKNPLLATIVVFLIFYALVLVQNLALWPVGFLLFPIIFFARLFLKRDRKEKRVHSQMDTLLEALKSYRTMAKPEAKDFSVAGPLSEIKNQKATGLVNEIKRLEDK